MSIDQIFTGLSQPDVARTTYGGVTFTCVSYLDETINGVRAMIFVEQADGQRTLLDDSTIFEDSNRSNIVDSPKALGRGQYFIVHWMTGPADTEAVEDTELHRSIFNLAEIASGWESQGNIATHATMMYDVHPIEGHATDFVLVHRTGDDQFSIYRFEPTYAWIDATWGPDNLAIDIATRVLGITADTTDTLVSWQRNDGEHNGQLWTVRVTTATGSAGGSAIAPTFGLPAADDLLDNNNDFVQVTHARVTATAWMVIAEFVDRSFTNAGAPDVPFTDGKYLRAVGFTTITALTALRLHNAHWFWHGSLISKAWSWASGIGLARNVYAVIGFKSIRDGQEFFEQYGFVVDFDFASVAGASEAQTVYPKVVDALMSGAFDGRPSGWMPGNLINDSVDGPQGRRANHLSHAVDPPAYVNGPDLKSITTAHLAWGRLVPVVTEQGELEPAMPRVRLLTHYHEAPWTIRRDSKEPTAPDENYRGAAHRCSGPAVEAAGFLVRPGGVTALYDGHMLVEHGFFHTPEIFQTEVSNGGGLEPTATYWYTCNYAWPDKKGQLHRGPLAQPVEVTTTGTDLTVTLTVRTMTLSQKDSPRHNGSDIYIEFWRTSVDGLSTDETEEQAIGIYTFRRLHGANSGAAGDFQLRDTPTNDRSTHSIEMIDVWPDSDLITQEPAPWQLNTSTLQWTPPPPMPHMPLRILTVWENRVWGVNPEDDRTIVYSDEILPLGTQYVAPEFLDTNTYRFDGRGEIVAMRPMDNRLFIFTRDGIYALVGDPNNGLGEGATLRLEVVADAIGCIEPRSVCLIPAVGIFFQSPKGPYLFTRETGLQYIGAEVEDDMRAAGNIRSAVLLEDRHQIRVSIDGTPSGASIFPRVLIFDYLVKKWSRINAPAVGSAATARLNQQQSACQWRGESGEALHVMLQQGAMGIERASDDESFVDEAAAGDLSVDIDITTAWISLAGIGGLKRVREVGVQAERLNDDVELSIDYLGDNDGTFDDDALPEHFEQMVDDTGYVPYRPARGKVSAFKVHIYESGTIPPTANLKITGMSVSVGVKQGLKKVVGSQKGVPT